MRRIAVRGSRTAFPYRTANRSASFRVPMCGEIGSSQIPRRAGLEEVGRLVGPREWRSDETDEDEVGFAREEIPAAR